MLRTRSLAASSSLALGAASLFWLVLAALVPSAAAKPGANDWNVASIARTLELGGVTTFQTDIHMLKGLGGNKAAPTSDADVPPYYFALSQADASRLGGLEATARFGAAIKPEQRRILTVKDEGLLDTMANVQVDANGSDTRPHLYSVQLPAAFLQKEHPNEPLPDTALTISGILTHASEPLPRSIGQSEAQFLLWRGDAAIMSPYNVETARIKVKMPQPQILSHSTEPDLGAEMVTKSGSTITYGPFKNVPSIVNRQAAASVPRASIHYQYNLPMLTFVTAKREAKVSHWRNTLHVQDDYWIRSDGAKLKGHFSRISHQMNMLVKQEKNHVISGFTLNLPPGADGAYFTDESGNVSTSRFRPSPPSPQSISTPAHLLTASKASLLQLQPRYPLLGGWNYTCSVGFAVRLTDGWRKSLPGSRYAVQVPFMTSAKDIAVDRASLRVILPEGASNIAIRKPFAVDLESRTTSWSFLDTTGKPVIELEKAQCSERHGGLVTIEYTLTPLDHFRKIVVALLLSVLGVVTLLFGSQVDLSLKA